MAFISPNDIPDGTTAEAADVNANINLIADEMNGNLDSNNLADGAVTTSKFASDAKLPAAIAFSVHLNSAQSIPAATFTKVELDTEQYDRGGHFDSTTNNRFVAPVHGIYHFDGAVSSSGNMRGIVELYKNGSVVRRGSDRDVASWRTGVVSADIELEVNDYVELYFWNDLGNNASGGSNLTYLTGHLVGVI